jgi:uncharacterized membrane protein YbhN (UPF0104 family)
VTLDTEPGPAHGDAPLPTGRRITVRRAVRIGWIALLILALVLALRSRWGEVAADLATLDIAWLVAAALAGLVGLGLSAGIWHTMLVGIGEPLPDGASLRIFYVGQIGKYLPGAVWPAVTQAALARDHDVAPRATVSAVTLFLWVHLVTGAGVGLVVLAAMGALPAWTLLGVPALLALLWPPVLRWCLQRLLRLARREPLRALPDGRHLAAACAWALGMWVAYGVHLHAATAAVGQPVGPWRGAGIFAAAWFAGFVLLVAPAGVGPREAAMVALLPLDAATGLLVALVSRLIMTGADAVWATVTGVRPSLVRPSAASRGRARPSDT